MHRVIRVMRDRMAMLMVEEAGMSTVEYSTVLKTYHTVVVSNRLPQSG